MTRAALGPASISRVHPRSAPCIRAAGILFSIAMSTRIAAIALIVSVVFFRVALALAGPAFSGYAPLAALVLGAAVLLPQARFAWLPAAAFLASDILLNVVVYKTGAFQSFLWVTLGFYVLLFLGGRGLSRLPSLALPFLGSTAAAAVAFHVVANTASWMADPLYAKTMAGWVQANTTGVPGFPPAWLFLVKSLAGNLAFAGLFLVALAPMRRSLPATVEARA